MDTEYSECEELVYKYGITVVCKNLAIYCLKRARERSVCRNDEQGKRLWTYYARKLEEINP